MNTASHGGECCGIKHIYNLNSVGQNGQNTIAQYLTHVSRTGIYEVVATDYQLNNVKQLMPQLRDAGFYLVSRAYNPNSENYINIFHKVGCDHDDRNMADESPYTAFLNQPTKEEENV